MPVLLGKSNFHVMCQWHNLRRPIVDTNIAKRAGQEMSKRTFCNFSMLKWEMTETFQQFS